ncbi:nitrate/nitrite two-component system sensor histidine kinase NarQ [Shewanella sp. C32]|uniref:Sensor protein n=1 Tax=Shewanella electrica TaxID=515560 RepID=A0ABT2FIU6_9GAMM|nr:nitrate/nitrite two-component system sensor histidine kinase NarQ [Shewanella electrica]MCH1924358.1 nitrate/nitrite two-component system sensor histidine kinase NarQ [Shewanella electrica]MCS4556259.1 nitrate/nitrite two-component system sensor histidine kinase NarQ [Shewanella electrica]
MIKRSLTATILGMMMLLILLSSGLATFSIVNLSYSVGDARAINASGSLRMQSYRLLFYANSGSEATDDKIQEFEQTLHSDALTRSLDWSSPQALKAQYQLVIEKWQQMKTYAEQENSRAYAASVKDFVDTIDKLVLEMEHHAAFKLRLLVILQVIGLSMMIVIAFVTVRFMRRKVAQPLGEMMQSANIIAQGRFDVAIPTSEYNELSTLSEALTYTVKQLASIYGDLESQVKEKTLALTKANNELTFLYDKAIMLNSGQLNLKLLQESLIQLKDYQQLSYLRLIIQQDDEEMEVISATEDWPANASSTCFPVTFEQQRLGYLEVICDNGVNEALFLNYALMLARSIIIHNASEERQQLALLEERAVIARELHDSLGQLLSFLKIQISLLRKALDEQGYADKVDQQLTELNQGVNLAYSQLRELLSTFRLTVKEPNLRIALESMLEQLRSQTDVEISLNYRLPSHLLAAHQHIHILQLTREATLNAIKHAKARHIDVSCEKNAANMAVIRICDDGIGLDHIQEREQHFGLGIMHERANRLSGKVTFSANPNGGACVTLEFPPQQESDNG